MFRNATLGGAVATTSTVTPRFLLTLFTALLSLACGDSDPTIVGLDGERPSPSLADAQLAIVAGDAQDGLVAAFLTDPLVVEVQDGSGAPFGGVLVEWTFQHGAGHSQGLGNAQNLVRTTTDASGRTSVTWQLGSQAGLQSASAEIVDPGAGTATSSGASPAPGNNNGRRRGFQANGRPSAADTILVAPADVAINVGDSVQLQAEVRDKFQNVISGAPVTWSPMNESVAQVTETGVVRALSDGVSGASATSGSAAATVSVTSMGGTNELPTAAITSPAQDVSIALGDAVSFAGTASDPDGTVQAHSWTLGDGNTATVEDPGTYTYASPGTYGVTYRTRDDAGDWSAVAGVTVTVAATNNQSPTASIASPAQGTTITLGDAVDFQGAASDPDGTILSHTWSFGDGSSASVEDPGAYTYGSAGTFGVTYQVTDDQGASSTVQSRTVTVTAPSNQPPVAAISSPGQDLTVTLGQSVNFQGTASDPDGTVAAHSWWFGDGNTSDVEDPGTYTYASTGTYTATYRVGDDQGLWSAIAGRSVTVVAGGNQPPTASITSPGQDVTIVLGQSVDFQGSASDPDGSIQSHAWTFGDGATSSAADPGSYTYAALGTYPVTYQATDDEGAASALRGRTVTVVATPPPPPPPGSSNVLFSSDWSTGTGDGAAARMDGSWTRHGNSPFTVVPNTYDFPTTNVLEQVNSDFGWVGFDPRDGVITSTLQAGDSRAWRYYIRYVNRQTTVSDGNTHALFDGFSIDGPPSTSTATTWFQTQNISTEIFHPTGVAPGNWSLTMRVKAGLPSPIRYSSPTLAIDQTYRVEWQVTMASATTYNLDAYIITLAGDTIATPADWRAEGTSGTLANESPIAVNNSASAFSGYWFGLNGYEGADGALYTILGAVAICDSWCGPYPIAGVEAP